MEPRSIIPTTQATCQVCGLAWPVALEMGLDDMVRYCIRYHHAMDQTLYGGEQHG